jgi:tetrahydromethanopterin S-methyltransferase subunit F
MRSCRLLKGNKRKLALMTVSSPNVIEIELDRLIDDVRLLRSQMITFDRRLKVIEAYGHLEK